MNLIELGYNPYIEKQWIARSLTHYVPGRVVAEHRERYVVATENGEVEAEITGNLRFTSRSREDFPAVGDWVALSLYDSGVSLIHAVVPRFSGISRQAPGQQGGIQLIAANVDYGLIAQAADRDFNINRIERYLTICHTAGVEPVLIFTKTDLLLPGLKEEMIRNVRTRLNIREILAVSNLTTEGYESLTAFLMKGKTYCLLGSSGAGKSTLVNNLTGKHLMKTSEISTSTGKGKHSTSHRELILLDNGAILIDNPGMREIGVTDASDGIIVTFDRIAGLAGDCRFKDCSHSGEAGCAVTRAVEQGLLDGNHYANYLRIQREKSYFETSQAERKRKERMFGKILKHYNKMDVKGRDPKSMD